MLSCIKNLYIRRNSAKRGRTDPPLIIPRARHSISRENISENTLKVLYRLNKAGYQGFLVGGGVRDLLLGLKPKDFDVATSATPEEVRRLFRNCRLIGRRFRLAHIRFGREIIEVATFRAQHVGNKEGVMENGMIVRDNVYGTLEEDAWRRDFTINALYYNIKDFSVIDHTGGMADLEAGCLRMIGDPMVRFREDPVRMLRAVRFAAKFGFRIQADDDNAIYALGSMLEEVSAVRLFDEVLKLFLAGYAVPTFELLRQYGLFRILFPITDEWLSHEENNASLMFLTHALDSIDQRVSEGKPVAPAFLFALLLWDPVRYRTRELVEQRSMPVIQAMQIAGDVVLREQARTVNCPRRFGLQARDIWVMQERFLRQHGKRARAILGATCFRAAYDFLQLRIEGEPEVRDLVEWWRRFQHGDDREREQMLRGTRTPHGRQRRQRSKKRVAVDK